jgi:phosphoglycerol transferase
MAPLLNFLGMTEPGSAPAKYERLGAPFGLSYGGPYTYLSNYNLLILFFISRFIKEPGLAVNITFLYLFPAISLISYFVLRSIRTNRIIAILGGLTYAFSPYIMFRHMMHLNLSTYLFVPLAILLCFWVYMDNDFLSISGSKGFLKYKRNIYASIFIIFIGSNGTGYYPIFSCYALFITGLSCLFIKEKRINSIKSAILIFGIALTVLLNITYGIIHNEQVHYNYANESRPYFHAEYHGLKIIQLLKPFSAHGISKLQNLLDVYNASAPLTGENNSAYLGVVGCLGFIFLILVLFTVKKRPEYNLLSKLNLFFVLLGTIGGFSSMIALFLFPILRGYNRISIFILFISILALCLFLQECIEKKDTKKRTVYYFVILLVFVFGIFEPIQDFRSTRSMLIAQFDSNEEYYGIIEDMNDKGAMIFQLPYQPHPIVSKTHFLISFVHSKTLKWSGGSFLGTEGERFYKNTCSLPIEKMLEVLKAHNFSGIELTKELYSTIPEQFEETTTTIESLLGRQPLIDFTGNIYYYSLKEENIKKINQIKKFKIYQNTGFTFSDEFYNLEKKSGSYLPERDAHMQWRWAKRKAELVITNSSLSTICVRFSFKIGPSLKNNFIRVSYDNTESEYRMNEKKEIILDLEIPPGGVTINFETDAPKVVAPNDPRELYFRLINPVLLAPEE